MKCEVSLQEESDDICFSDLGAVYFILLIIRSQGNIILSTTLDMLQNITNLIILYSMCLFACFTEHRRLKLDCLSLNVLLSTVSVLTAVLDKSADHKASHGLLVTSIAEYEI